MLGTYDSNTIQIFMILEFPSFKLSYLNNHISICYLFIDIVHEVILMLQRGVIGRLIHNNDCPQKRFRITSLGGGGRRLFLPSRL